MLNATSMFGNAADIMSGKRCEPLNEFLDAFDARPSTELDNPAEPDLPALASHEKHEFDWSGSRVGSVELIHSGGEPLQLAVSLPYPKRRWFSPRRKDWKKLADIAEDRFGPGQKIEVAGKTGLHFRERNLLALICRYDKGSESFIEVKLASGRFWR